MTDEADGPTDVSTASAPTAPASRPSQETPALAGPQPRTSAAPARRLTGDRYRVGTRLGRGGMGEVLEAHDTQIGRDVAIKRMRDPAPSDAQMQRFLREGRIQGRLEHPAIVPVHELGRDVDGRPYFAMKRLTGTTLAEILAHDDAAKFPRQRLLRSFSDICLAVEFAHTRGIIHRDLKPANLMLGDFGETYVLDWGVAKVIGEPDDDAASPGEVPVTTTTGAAVGTAGYMSPEQAHGDRDVDARADVYALGCVLFEILTGERLHPRGAAGLTSTVAGIDARPSLRAPDREIPPELEVLCTRATALDRQARIPSARELGETVQRFLDGDRDLALRRTLAAQHLDVATTALAVDDRRVAIREAGRALALDPTLSAAGALITRLLLEPPREMPAELALEVAREDERIVRRNARLGAFSNAGYLLFVPFLALTTAVPAWQLLAIGLVAVANAAYLHHLSRPGVRFRSWPVIAMSTVSIVIVARMTSPFLIGMPIAVATIVGLVAGPAMTNRKAVLCASLQCLAVFAPWLAERGGLLSPTMRVEAGTMTLTSPIFASALVTYGILVVLTIVVVFMVMMLTRRMRGSEAAARQHVHVQSWQLRQLMAS